MEKLIKSRSKVKRYAVYAHYYKGIPFYIGSGIYHRDNISKSRAYNFINRGPDWFNYCNGETEKIEVELLFQTNDRKLAFDKEEEITRYYMELEAPLVNVDIGNKRSEEWIKKHGSGENHPMYGKKHSEETRELISLAKKGWKGYWCGKKGKDNPNYGSKRTLESRKRMSLAAKGRKRSEETRGLMSLAKKGGNNPKAKKVLIINNENGETKVFGSIKDAHEFISQNGFDKTKVTLQNYLNKGPFSFKDYTMKVAKDMVYE